MEFKSFEDFRDQFIEDVKQKLDEQGTDVSKCIYNEHQFTEEESIR